MNKQERIKQFIAHFSENMPEAKTELEYKNAFELTVAVVLSAQCTDKRVNIITKNLFKEMPVPQVMAEASIDAIFDLIKSCSYPRNKAKHLSGLAKMVIADFNGKIPANLEDLQKLPGVGRKTANVVGSVYFDIPAMPVDTHVFRVANRIGLTKNAKNPLESELQLLKLFPKEKLNIAHHWLILHGRYLCKARRPECERCGITSICNYFLKK
ncbi:MAG: endonuclease III [Cryomorphaceae bacterium BACL11 MAG-121001-bin54]|nr:MAG: endonuclease III [Cryomorphaceae bacterium BACL11 MAG-121001-bin54]MBC8296170.1 endonuclease III [Pelagibacterales bacterium]MDA0681723.1 endonuclease III [Bacteroidota bacterium]